MKQGRLRYRTSAGLDYRDIMEAAAEYVEDDKPRLPGAREAVQFVRPLLQGKPQEEMWVLHLDVKSRAVGFVPATVGLANQTMTHPREIFRAAIVANASRIILAHNHPSGDPTPSSQDIRSTRELRAAGKIIGIEIVDHIVIGYRTELRPEDYVSFAESHLL